MSFFPWNKKNKEKNKEKSGNVGKLNKAHLVLILDTFCLNHENGVIDFLE